MPDYTHIKVQEVPREQLSRINRLLTDIYTSQGRWGRKKFIMLYFVLMAIIGIPFATFFFLIPLDSTDSPLITGLFYALIPLIILGSITMLFATIKRLHDCNLSGWWVLSPLCFFVMFLIPFPFSLKQAFANVFSQVGFILLFLARGDTKENNYGADPLQGKTETSLVQLFSREGSWNKTIFVKRALPIFLIFLLAYSLILPSIIKFKENPFALIGNYSLQAVFGVYHWSWRIFMAALLFSAIKRLRDCGHEASIAVAVFLLAWFAEDVSLSVWLGSPAATPPLISFYAFYIIIAPLLLYLCVKNSATQPSEDSESIPTVGTVNII